jgi:hypothetical protein
MSFLKSLLNVNGIGMVLLFVGKLVAVILQT